MSAEGYFYYEVQRSLRNGRYDFKLNAVPGVVYELYVSGKPGLNISFPGDSQNKISLLGSWTYSNAAYVTFSSPEGGEISIKVNANETGSITVEWFGIME